MSLGGTRMSIVETGYASEEELARCPGVPSRDRMLEGPVAVLECFQEIPCDPCKAACSFGAISLDGGITSLPRLDASLCKGCGKCIAACPGQAIFVVDGRKGTVSLPYEFLPVPSVGDVVDCFARDGTWVTKGKVLKVDASERNDRTVVVTVQVGTEYYHAVRAIRG